MLSGTESGGYFHPRFSPDASFVVSTTENYYGLTKHDIASGSRLRLTDAPSAGYGMCFSDDGSSIYYSRAEMRNAMRFMSLERVNTFNSKKFSLGIPMRLKLTPARFVSRVYLTTEDDGMMLHHNGKTTLLAPLGKESYYWATVSPDGKHIVFSTAYHGTCICDINGENVVRLGRLNAPQWLGNDCVIGMQETDDEKGRTLQSKLVVRSVDGKTAQTLLLGQKVAMYPSASADGKHVSFNNEIGQIFIVDLE